MLKLIDSHCHLDFAEFDKDRDTIIERCFQSGMQAMVVPGVKASSWLNLKGLASNYDRIFPAYGLHPYFHEDHRPEDLEALEQFLDLNAVAVGEIGLDLYDNMAPLEQQLRVFEAQLHAAINHQLPIIVHCRKAYDLLIQSIRKNHFKYGGIMHAFSGSQQQAEQLIDMGFKIGFGGAATYDRAKKLRKLFQTLPLSSIVLETDSPDMPPSFARGERNSPSNLFKISELLAELRGIPRSDLADATSHNVRTLLGLPDH